MELAIAQQAIAEEYVTGETCCLVQVVGRSLMSWVLVTGAYVVEEEVEGGIKATGSRGRVLWWRCCNLDLLVVRSRRVRSDGMFPDYGRAAWAVVGDSEAPAETS